MSKEDPAEEASEQPVEETNEEREEVEGDEQHEGSEMPAVEAFEALAHDIRLGIIEALAERRRTNWYWQGLRFSELRDRVGVPDGGKFSYHLDQLTPSFVVKDGEEYKLTYAGMQVAGEVVAGTYNELAAPRRGTVDVACPTCGERVEAVYEYHYFRLVCENDDDVLYGTTLPPGAAEGRSIEELAALADADARHDLQRARNGVCPHCWGRMEMTLPATGPFPQPDAGIRDGPEIDGTFAAFDCGRCGFEFWMPAGSLLVDEPAVVAFYHDHGIDVREKSALELQLFWAQLPHVESEDPTRVLVPIELDGETLRVTMDGDATVIASERVD